MEYIIKEKAFNDEAKRFFNNLPDETKEGMIYKRLSLGEIEFIEMYRDDGKAKPLMFVIHGGPGCKEQMLDAFSTKSYSANAYSQEGFYVIIPDAAAHGEDTRGPMINMDAWLETVRDIDILIEYAETLKQADAKRFGVAGVSMGGTITFLYGAKGRHKPSVLLPEIGTPDFTGILNGRADLIMFGGMAIGVDVPELKRYFLKNLQISESALKEVENYLDKTKDNIRNKARELSAINHIERFVNIPMYGRFGGKDDISGSEGVRLFIDKLKKAGGTIQEFIIHEEHGHGGFPDDYNVRMSYVKKSMGMGN